MSEEAEVVLSLKDQLEADRQRRVQLANQQVSDILKELECDLVGVPQFTADGRITVLIQLVAK